MKTKLLNKLWTCERALRRHPILTGLLAAFLIYLALTLYRLARSL